jgi:hypothetical protein
LLSRKGHVMRLKQHAALHDVAGFERSLISAGTRAL